MKSAQLLFQLPQDADSRERFGVFALAVVIHDGDGGDVNRLGGLASVGGGLLRLDGQIGRAHFQGVVLALSGLQGGGIDKG